MTKILLIAIAFAAAFWLLRNHRRNANRGTQSRPDLKAEDMVSCVHCGVHLPRGDGISAGQHYFCSKEHEQEFLNKR